MATYPTTFWQTLKSIGHNAPMRRALPFLSLVLVIGLSGCSPKSPSVNLPMRPKKYLSVVSLSPNTTELILSDANAEVLKGRTQSCDWPPAMVKNIPVVASVKPNLEAIQQIKPDLIVCDTSLYSPEDIAKIKSATNADVFTMEAKSVDEFVKKLQEMGTLFGTEMRFNDYVNRIIAEMGSASGTKYSPVPKVAIVMPSASGDDYIVGTDGFHGDVVRIAGGQIVGPKGTGFVPLNAESLVSLNPDVILIPATKTEHSGYDAFMKDPRFATVTAIKQGRVGAIESNVLLRDGQRVDELIKATHRLLAPAAK